MLPHAEIGGNDHREEAPYFIKMFKPSGKSDHSKSLKKFIEFLKQSKKEKENRIEDDLGFEINFGAFQPEQKVSFFQLYFNLDFFTQFIDI